MLTSQPWERKKSAACEPMKPAPPVTRTFLAIVRVFLRRCSVSGFSFEAEEIACGIDYTEAASIRGRGAQSHTGLVQKLVHQTLGKMFDYFRLFRRHCTEPPHRHRELRASQPVHLLSDSTNDRQEARSSRWRCGGSVQCRRNR